MSERRPLSFESDYVEILYRDIIEEIIFKRHDGAVKEVALIRKGKPIRLDLAIKYGNRLLGIEVKTAPYFDDGIRQALKYRENVDTIFLAFPQDWAIYAQEARKMDPEYSSIGLISISLNARSRIEQKATTFSPHNAVAKETLIKRNFMLDLQRQRKYLDQLALFSWHTLSGAFSRQRSKNALYLVIAIYVLSKCHSPIKYWSTETLTATARELGWRGSIINVGKIYDLGVLERYMWGQKAYFRLHSSLCKLENYIEEYLHRNGLFDEVQGYLNRKRAQLEEERRNLLGDFLC